MLTKKEIEIGLHNLNASYAVIEPEFKDGKFKFYYREEIQEPIGGGKFLCVNSGHMVIYENDCFGDFFKKKFAPGHYVNSLFSYLDKTLVR